VYTAAELKVIASFAHANGLLLHVDGARIANAAAHLGISVKEMITDTGVDVLSFGGTKNGLMYGEAVVALKPELAVDLKYFRKQAMQLSSKMRYIAAQFDEYLRDGLWLENAARSNRMAKLLEHFVRGMGVAVTQRVEANEVFAVIPQPVIEDLRREFAFYTWDEARGEVRWVCSWDTTEDDIEAFAEALLKLLDKYREDA